MDAPTTDRRRVARHEIHSPAMALLPAFLNVTVQEISVLGVLLHAAEPLVVGEQGLLRITLSGVPFAVDVQVRRVTKSQRQPSGYDIATTFVAITHEHRQQIMRFVKE